MAGIGIKSNWGIAPLTGDNYPEWAMRTESALKLTNASVGSLWTLVKEGKPALLAKLEAKGSDSSDLETKKAKIEAEEDQAKAFLSLNVGSQHLTTVYKAPSAKEAWDGLKASFLVTIRTRKIQLQRDLNNARKADTESTIQFIARVTDIWHTLKELGIELAESTVVGNILVGLPPKYETLITVLMAGKNDTTISAVTAELLGWEQRHEQSDGVHALYARGNTGSKAGFSGVKNKGHQATGPCSHCGKPGHTPKTCWKLHPELKKDRKPFGSAGSKVTALMASVTDPGSNLATVASSASGVATASLASSSVCWTIDSGASKHMTADRSQLSNIKSLDHPVTVQFGNGHTSQAREVGQTTFTAKGGSVVQLNGVLYTPACTAGNLFSVIEATSKGATLTFKGNECELSHSGQVVAKIAHSNGRYALTAQPEFGLLAATGTAAVRLWHERLGHLGPDGLLRLVTDKMVTGIDLSAAAIKAAKAAGDLCPTCVLGKATRFPFTGGNGDKAKQCLELLHSDLMGPIEPKTVGGNRFMLTVMDDYSGFSTIHLLVSKTDAPKAVMHTIEKLETITGKKVKVFRSDNGGEFINHQLQDYLAGKGITHQTSAPYSPQQNGAAERLNRILVDKSRCMLLGSGLDLKYWGEAIGYANLLRNLSPTASRTKTPHELLRGTKPDLGGLRIFGARAYVLTPKPLRDSKMAPVAKTGTFVGVQEDSKLTYRVLVNGRIAISRNVTFDESVTGTAAAAAPSPVESPVFDFNWTEGEGEQTASPYQTDMAAAAPPPAGTAAPGADQAPARRELPARNKGNFDKDAVLKGSGGTLDDPRNALAHLVTEGTDFEVPTSYKAAINSPQAKHWQLAIDSELQAMSTYNTWELIRKTDLPPDTKLINSRWVFAIKRNQAGGIERYKARLVAKGFMQREGIDFTETYAPTSRHTSLRLLLALVPIKGWYCQQWDISTAFLNGDLEETVYLSLPEGLEHAGSGLVCKLNKALYGLCQAPRAWHTKLKAKLESMGLTQCSADPSVFYKRGADGELFAAVHVDDFLVVGKPSSLIDKTREDLEGAFKLKNLGLPKKFNGFEIEIDNAKGYVKIHQAGMAADLAAEYNLLNCSSKAIPMSPTAELIKDSTNPLDTNKFPYSKLIGSLLYLGNSTRPDIAYAVGALARHMSAPTPVHWNAAMYLLRYVAGTPHLGICYYRDKGIGLKGYCDASFGDDRSSRRSTTGNVFLVAGGAISWSSKLQQTVAISTAESELQASCSATKEAKWLRKLFSDIGIDIGTVQIGCDNQAAIALIKNPIASQRSKHIDIIYHFSRECAERGEVSFSYVPSELQLADIMTKALPVHAFQRGCTGLGMA
jgi:transposase InsO family protein